MTTLKITALALVGGALIGGCTARDFFGYRDDAPLHAIERPSDFPTTTFGAEIAATYYNGAQGTADLAAISGGEATPTVFYRLSSDGRLVDIEDPWDDFRMDALQAAKSAGSGAALAGLPTWAMRSGGAVALATGCTAIGEPTASNVRIRCPIGAENVDLPGSATGEGTAPGFGRALAAIPPIDSANWLLAVAADHSVTVFSSASAADRTEPAVPSIGGHGFVVEIAGGALADGRFFVAAATAATEDVPPSQVHLFVQVAPHAQEVEEVACVDRAADPGFGGSMTAGDLDRDGDDELIVSSASADARVDAVYVYDVTELAAAGPMCAGDAPPPAATATPGDGPLDIGCEAGAACDFGAALAVGDIATDDAGQELLVGAPGATVDGKKRAGAVFVYRGAELMAAGTAAVAGRIADSAPEKGQRFGGAVAAVPMAGRTELFVGAVGKGTVFVAYCTGVGADIEQGADVTRNANGKVVSTRCRPR
jgi:hypothetical protein